LDNSKKYFFYHYPTSAVKGGVLGCIGIEKAENQGMKYLPIILLLACGSCTSMKLAIPTTFKEQAAEFHVSGAQGNRISFAEYKTSRIKRGMHVTYPGWSFVFTPENILLNQVGLEKGVSVVHERAKFRYTMSDGRDQIEVYGQEKSTKRNTEFSLVHEPNIGYERLDEYKYIFSSAIKTDTAYGNWEFIMTNIWERKKDPVKSIFTYIPRDDYGYATNGTDSIYINPISLKHVEMRNGKQGDFPLKMLGGYELSTSDGVIAIIDLVGSNIWLYNELGRKERLIIAGITTALLARKVNRTEW
jgi:hypothetical protein